MPQEGSPLPNINNYPILNQQEAARIFQASFQKDCGINDICESDLRLNARLNLTRNAFSLTGIYKIITKIKVSKIYQNKCFFLRTVHFAKHL